MTPAATRDAEADNRLQPYLVQTVRMTRHACRITLLTKFLQILRSSTFHRAVQKIHRTLNESPRPPNLKEMGQEESNKLQSQAVLQSCVLAWYG